MHVIALRVESVGVQVGFDNESILITFAHRSDETRAIFSIDGGPWAMPCDDPGCGDLLKISGVVYPVRQGNDWGPQIKATYDAEFPFPDEKDAPNGDVRSTIHLQKQ